MALLDSIKIYLSISDTIQDDLLNEIIGDVTNRVNSYIGEPALPVSLEWIVKELSITRFNRIGSEGIKTDVEEGKSLTFADDPFLLYESDLDDFIRKRDEPAEPSRTPGRARFI